MFEFVTIVSLGWSAFGTTLAFGIGRAIKLGDFKSTPKREGSYSA